MDEQAVLAYDTFAEDEGHDGDKVLRDKIVKARKEATCCMCGGEITKGMTIRSITSIYAGEIGTARYCTECCEAMGKWYDDGGKAVVARYNIAFERGKS